MIVLAEISNYGPYISQLNFSTVQVYS